jgi:cell division protein FtsW
MARSVDLAPSGPLALPITGIGRGWEAAAIMILTLLILSLGLVTLYSASAFLAQREALPDYYYVLRQATGVAVGLGVLGVCAWIPHDLWRRLAWPMVIVAWVLLVIVIAPGTESIAPEINGARRWLRVGPNLQPSELAKVAVVVWTAAVAIRKQEEFSSLRRGLAPFLLVWTALMVPIALEPDLSTALIVGLMGCLVVYVAGARLTHFLFLGLLAVPVLYTQLEVSFRARRMVSYLNPSADPAGAGFQVHQSLLAFGSGGVAGVGFGQGRQKLGFLPEAHNDFIFSMIGEEWGLVGVTAAVLLYLLLILIGFRIASRAPDLFGQLVAVGLTSMIAMHAILHMAVGLGLVPATGLALPLISYGRSNLLVTLASLGILMSISRASSERPLPVGRRARA